MTYDFANLVNIEDIIDLASQAGQEILKIYNDGDFNIKSKGDGSPFTCADKASSDLIETGLKDLYTDINILSEEQNIVTYDERKDWEYFWLVDPLDGTKEFIKKNGEFTINIALIYKGLPVLGVIYIPVKNELFYAIKNKGAYKVDINRKVRRLKVDNKELGGKITVVVSRSHRTKEVEDYLDRLKNFFPEIKEVSTGSALKFCMIAENKAHIYPRFGPTKEWDTAAGQIIVEEAGGRVIDIKTNAPLKYNKKEITNNHFVMYGPSQLLENIERIKFRKI